MIIPGSGPGELLTSFILVEFNLALPLASLLLLYKIYFKLKNIEEHLKEN